MTDFLGTLLAVACCALVAGSSGVAFVLATERPAPRPALGNRGLKRARSLRSGGLFATVEPLVRYGAAWFARAPLRPLRARLEAMLVQSGDYLGLSTDELFALSCMSGASLGLLSVVVASGFGLPFALVPIGFVLGVMSPWFRVRAAVKDRVRSVTNGLPGVIELAAMCMGAGLDFPGALKRIVEAATNPEEPIIEELQRVLQELDLGRTRRAAMSSFADRVPSDEVRELVNSVIQAEIKGSPLAHILTIQAQTLRLRRSISAEETASEAALMLVGPMTLIFLCVIALLLGPVVVRVMAGGLQPV